MLWYIEYASLANDSMFHFIIKNTQIIGMSEKSRKMCAAATYSACMNK
ncbi:unnamed protein product [marine sediment metagenome]|uniref:Uncharacterized protein n=1 Tax=marine sediment metagenome TaxID=412755 RepID=X0TWL8_9ZZZZ